MKKRIKRKRILYVPGMISLALIPLFFLFHFSKNYFFPVNNGLNVSFKNEESLLQIKLKV